MAAIKIASKFDLWPVEDLVPYEKNSRLHDDAQVAGIAASIREFGFIAPIVVDTKRGRIAGDLWRLGAHRVLCGDSTSIEQTDTLLGGDLAVCLWTDPPYNVNYEGSAGKILNDHMADDEFSARKRA